MSAYRLLQKSHASGSLVNQIHFQFYQFPTINNICNAKNLYINIDIFFLTHFLLFLSSLSRLFLQSSGRCFFFSLQLSLFMRFQEGKKLSCSCQLYLSTNERTNMHVHLIPIWITWISKIIWILMYMMNSVWLYWWNMDHDVWLMHRLIENNVATIFLNDKILFIFVNISVVYFCLFFHSFHPSSHRFYLLKWQWTQES